MLIKIVILLSHVIVIEMSLVDHQRKIKSKTSCKKVFFEKTGKDRNRKTETDPDRKPTFQQKNDPDPDRSQKVNPAGL
jgi:hypothetical protein